MQEPLFVIDTEYTRHALTEMWRILYRRKFWFFKIVGGLLFLSSAFTALGCLSGFFRVQPSMLALLLLIGFIGFLAGFFPQQLMLLVNRKKLARHMGNRHVELHSDALLSTGTNGTVTRMPWLLLKAAAESRDYFFLDFGGFFSILSKHALEDSQVEPLRLFLSRQAPAHAKCSFWKSARTR